MMANSLYSEDALAGEGTEEYLDQMLAKGWIRPSKSRFGAGLFLVPKPGGKKRPVVDYRKLNSVTLKDATTLPLIPDILRKLSGAQVFTPIDLQDAFYQIRIAKGDEWKTAFRTPFWVVRVPGDAFRASQCTSNISTIQQLCDSGGVRTPEWCIPRQHSHRNSDAERE